MFQRVRECFRKRKQSTDSYEGAGCLFTDGIHVLAGYQPLKNPPVISGFGGKRLAEETNPLDTALRETIEELLHIKDVDQEVINDIKGEILPKKTILNGSYYVYVYSLIDLECMIYTLRLNMMRSPLYTVLPGNLHSLIFHRIQSESAEIRDICLLPVDCLNVCKSFAKDIKIIMEP